MTDFEPAEGKRLVTIGDGRVAFVHPLIRTAVVAHAAPADQRAVHRALAGSDQISLEARAWHLSLATQGLDRDAARVLATAAESASNRGDHATASKMLDRASELTPDRGERSATLLRAAEASRRAGHPERVRTLVEKGLREPVDGKVHARLLTLKSSVDRDPLAGHRMGLEAAALLAPHDKSAALEALHIAMSAGLAARSMELVRVAAQRALALDISTDQHAAYQRDALVGVALAIIGDLPGALPALTNILAAIERDDELRADPESCLHAVVAAGFFGRMGLISDLADEACVVARRRGMLSTLPSLLSNAGEAAAHRGDWLRAAALLSEAADLSNAMGDEDGGTKALAYLGEVQVNQGDDDAAATAATQRLRWADARGITRDRPPAVRVLAIVEMRAGQPELAFRRLAVEAGVQLDGRGVRNGPLTVIEDLIDAALLAGVPDAARGSCARLTAYAKVSPDPLASALAARCRAQLADDPGAETEYSLALTFHEQDLNAFAAARTRLRFGEWLRRKGRRNDARNHLHAALEVFDRLGAKPWAARTTAELRATGQSARRNTAASVRLTPQELRIGMAVAEGSTNQEVAARMFVSVKTVEFHLGAVFRKLGVTSRTQLARHPLFSATT
jgi:DNA-binding CsgD family transcriptional regulator